METTIDEADIIICVGLPSSGLREWSQDWVAEDVNERVRVCRRDIRTMIGMANTIEKEHEKLISVIHSTAVREALDRGFRVVIADNGLNVKEREKWTSYAHDNGYRYHLKYFPVSLNMALVRDNSAPIRIGHNAIRKMHEKYVKDHPILDVD